jgi:hypothetical protein
MGERRDWFTFADPAEVLRQYQAGPQDMDEIRPGQWGVMGVGVICLGDTAHMRKVAAKIFADTFHRKPCPMDRYPKGEEPLPTVVDRLGLVDAT